MNEHPEWYYNGKHWLMKLMRFLNLLEDGSVKLSLTGIGVWTSTLQALYTTAFVHDGMALTGALAQNAVWAVSHWRRRAQILGSK